MPDYDEGWAEVQVQVQRGERGKHAKQSAAAKFDGTKHKRAQQHQTRLSATLMWDVKHAGMLHAMRLKGAQREY
eukprot:3154-Heterococcus_DN1.PRE.2